MKLDEYWSRLEYLVSAALYDDGRGYWCDGFIPDEFVLSEDGQTVHGRAWIGKGPRTQKEWRFVLHLTGSPADADDVNWARQLPSEEAPGWLQVESDFEMLTIRPPSKNEA